MSPDGLRTNQMLSKDKQNKSTRILVTFSARKPARPNKLPKNQKGIADKLITNNPTKMFTNVAPKIVSLGSGLL